MKKNAIILITMLSSSLAFSQVGINTEDPKSTLDVNGDARIRTINAGSIADDVLVADTEGEVKKVSRSSFNIGGGGSSGFNSSILGYEPQPVANKVVPPTAPGGANVTELGCKKLPANGHTYCAYELSKGTNWFNSFLLGKQLGGYLVTLPNDAEREWVYANIVNPTTGYNLQNSVWLGFNKITRPGNPVQLQWITGEEFRIDWSTNPASAENWFNSGEPNNAGGHEGAVQILAYGSDSQRRWNDLDPNVTESEGRPYNQLIIEFNE